MAFDISPEKMAAYKRTALAREAQKQREDEKRRQVAWPIAEQAAQLLKEEFEATRVIVFGSLAHGGWFHARSDIDLAVAGVPSKKFWRAWAELDRLRSPFEINLVPLESVTEGMEEEIERYGVEL